MKPSEDPFASLYFLSGGGEMGELIRNFDWSETSLGHPKHWPQILRIPLSMILSSKFPMLIWWGEDLIQFYNDAYRPSLGKEGKHPTALGQKGKDCWPEVWEIIYPLIQEVKDNKNATWSEDHLIPIYRNGKMEEGYWTFSYSPIFGIAGEVEGILVVCAETTEKVQSRKAVRESEQRFRTMAEASNILISVADKKMSSTYFNKAWVDLTGRSREELLKMGWYDLLKPVDRQVFVHNYKKAIEKKESFEGEFRVLDRNGNYRWLLIKVTALCNPDGSPEGYISSSADISEIKQSQIALQESESNLRQTILHAPVAMCILKGPDYTVELANQRMFEFWGKSPELVINKPLFEGVPEARDRKAILNQVFLTGKPISAEAVEINLLRKGKLETVYVNFLYEPLREAGGEISGILKVAVDVTQEVIARLKIADVVEVRTKELAKANRNLQKSNAGLAQFAYIASHDLQEPLRKIRIFSQMLEGRAEQILDNQSKNYLEKIKNSTTRMSNLIRDVLNYSELDHKTDVFKSVDLNEVMTMIISDFELLIEEKNAAVTFEHLPVLEASPTHMSQLFGNLLGNALKFSRQDAKPHISISAYLLADQKKECPALDPSLEYFKIQIKDNGIGFMEEHKERIFNIFQRLHGKMEYPGTGIGLAMCKKIVLTHHGDLNADGSSQNGAVFNVILPKNQPEKPKE